jgi:hypothetical protein
MIVCNVQNISLFQDRIITVTGTKRKTWHQSENLLMKTSADPDCRNYISEVDPASRLKILHFSFSIPGLAVYIFTVIVVTDKRCG